MRTIFIFFAACAASGLCAQEQDAWSLRRCIDYAIGHNINIRQSDNAAKQSEIEVNTAKWARLPLPERLCQPELELGTHADCRA